MTVRFLSLGLNKFIRSYRLETEFKVRVQITGIQEGKNGEKTEDNEQMHIVSSHISHIFHSLFISIYFLNYIKRELDKHNCLFSLVW